MKLWPTRSPERQPMARQTLNDVPVSAAPEPVIDGKKKKSKKTPAIEDWQDLILLYADRIPIVSAACNYYSNATERVTYKVFDERTNEPAPDSPAQVIADILNAFPEEMGRAVELVFLIGEARQTFGQGELKTYGAGELARRGGKFVVLDENGRSEELPEDTRAWRTWKPDRRWSQRATSSHKSMLDLLEAFVIAYAEERAVSIRTAMNTGLVLVSEEIFRNEGGTDEGDPSETVGPDGRARLERRFEQMLQMTIKNPRNAASLQPPVLVVPGEDVSKMVAHVGFAESRDKRKIAERLDMLKKEYAVGVDLPADIAAGFLADLNHWNADSVDENAWKNYVAPKIQMVANNSFEELALGLGIDVDGFKIVPDGSELVSSQGDPESATKAWDRGLISDSAARDAYGFSEDDAAGPEDGPDVPIGADSAPSQSLFALETRPRPFVTDMERARLRKMSRDIEKSAKRMRDYISSELAKAAKALGDEGLTAAAGDPIETLTANIRRAILAQKEEMGLSAARALATKRAKDWYNNSLPELERRADRAATHSATVLQRVVKDGRFEAGFARDLTRSAESLGSGGPENVKDNGDVNNYRPAITQEDTDFSSMLRDEVETIHLAYGWQHGGSANPFPPHVELDGETWVLEDEREVLNNPDDYPASAIYYPGDHSGCSCSYDANYEVAP